MQQPTFNFQNVNEIDELSQMDNTSMANYLSILLDGNVKYSNETKLFFYYNEQEALWKIYSHVLFNHFISNVCSNMCDAGLAQLNKLEISNKAKMEYEKLIKKVKEKFDKNNSVVIANIKGHKKIYTEYFEQDLNTKQDYLPIQNGRHICLIDGKVTPRTKEDYWSYECPVEPVTSTLNAEKFFESVMPNEENREFLRKVLGYNLTGDTTGRKYFIWYGPNGNNGKSLIFDCMQRILGHHLMHSCAKSLIMDGANDKASGPSPELYAIIGKRSLVYSEGETTGRLKVNETQIKQISGEDMINCRGLYAPVINFKPLCKLNILTNRFLELSLDEAIRNRTEAIFFDRSFVDYPTESYQLKKDPQTVDKLKTIYLNEVFTWMVQGAINYYKGGKIVAMPQEFKTRTENLLSDMNSVSSFMRDRIERTPNKTEYLTKKDIWDAYNIYCQENQRYRKGRDELFKAFTMEVSSRHGSDAYTHIRFKETTYTNEQTQFEPYITNGEQFLGKNISLLGNNGSPLESELFEYKQEKENQAARIKELEATIAMLKLQLENKQEQQPKELPQQQKQEPDPIQEIESESKQELQEPVKRGRGRPKKQVICNETQVEEKKPKARTNKSVKVEADEIEVDIDEKPKTKWNRTEQVKMDYMDKLNCVQTMFF